MTNVANPAKVILDVKSSSSSSHASAPTAAAASSKAAAAHIQQTTPRSVGPTPNMAAPSQRHQQQQQQAKSSAASKPSSESANSAAAAAAATPARGPEIVGNYRLEKTIGQGTYGKVKLGVHVQTGEKVAIKVIEKCNIVNEKQVARIQREIRFLKLLQHPHIVKVYDVNETQDAIYIVMEYATGGELFDYIVTHKRVKEREARSFFRQVISAVDYCHKNSVIHRDLKPENLLLDDQKRIKIIDFGFGNTFQSDDLLDTFCGSPFYAAPEMILGKRYQGPEVDLWSMGVILFALLCGHLPFDDENVKELYSKIANGIYTIPEYLSPESKHLIRRMITVDPLKRATLEEVKNHVWINEEFNLPPPNYLPERPELDVTKLNKDIFQRLLAFGYDKDEAVRSLMDPKSNPIKNTYYLLGEMLKREEKKLRDEARAREEQRRNVINNIEPRDSTGSLFALEETGSGNIDSSSKSSVATATSTAASSSASAVSTVSPANTTNSNQAVSSAPLSATDPSTFQKQQQQSASEQQQQQQRVNHSSLDANAISSVAANSSNAANVPVSPSAPAPTGVIGQQNNKTASQYVSVPDSLHGGRERRQSTPEYRLNSPPKNLRSKNSTSTNAAGKSDGILENSNQSHSPSLSENRDLKEEDEEVDDDGAEEEEEDDEDENEHGDEDQNQSGGGDQTENYSTKARATHTGNNKGDKKSYAPSVSSPLASDSPSAVSPRPASANPGSRSAQQHATRASPSGRGVPALSISASSSKSSNSLGKAQINGDAANESNGLSPTSAIIQKSGPRSAVPSIESTASSSSSNSNSNASAGSHHQNFAMIGNNNSSNLKDEVHDTDEDAHRRRLSLPSLEAIGNGRRRTSSGSKGRSSELRTVSGWFLNVSTTSSKLPAEIIEEVTRVLNEQKITYAHDGGYVIECEDAISFKTPVVFEIEICKVPRLNLFGLHFKRINGSIWNYKGLCNRLVTLMKL